MRAVSAVVLVTAAATALTSCSALTGSPASAAGASASGPVLDPSVPSGSPTEQVASSTPLPTATATATSGPSKTAAARTAVVPFITTADWDAKAKALDVSAIVPGVVEGGGTCTVSVVSGSTTRTAAADGVAASSYTGCESVTFDRLAAGTWTVTVRYASDRSTGISAAKTVEVG